tara:strand:+ start:165 stop:611 length:447 start_codon:yes stop_codon:yes gene_type:complete
MRIHPIKFSFLLSLFMIVSIPIAAESDAIKVYDKGLDGSMRYYSVVCPNGKKTTITQMFEEFDAQEVTVELITSDSGEELVMDNTIKESSSGAIESLSETALDIKQKFIDLVDQDQFKICLYPINAEKQCKTYKDVDAAAKAACDLTG